VTTPFPDLENFLKEYNSIVSKAQSKAIFVRGIEFQKKEVDFLDALLKKTQQAKRKSIKEKNNKKSNFLLCLELCIEAVKNELLFIISLKEDKPDFAWECLITAQNAISLSIRNHPFNGDYLLVYAQRLHLYEQTLFPNMMFASRGCVVGKSECSICKKKYGDCNHIKGYAYMGEICTEINNEIISIEEISLVENPADKCCRILSYDENGKNYDVFTHREIIKT
jgi:hypothetical protein